MPNFTPVGEESVFQAIREVDIFDAIVVDSLHSAIGEHRLLFSVLKYTFHSSVWEVDLFSAVWEVLFSLSVAELIKLQSVRISRLSGFGVSEEVHDSPVCEVLFDVPIGEIDNGISVRIYFSFDSIRKDNFFPTILVNVLDFLATRLLMDIRILVFTLFQLLLF